MSQSQGVARRIYSYMPVSVRGAARQNRNRMLRLWGRAFLRELAPSPFGLPGTVSSDRLNELIRINNAQCYLEVGVAHGETIEAVMAARRIGVDPWPDFALDRVPSGIRVFRRTSDKFFERLPSHVRYDAIFLDGLHEAHQTMRDLRNALLHLSPRGFIVIDDTVPADSVAAIPQQEVSVSTAERLGLPFPRPWMGDVYKVVHSLSLHAPGLDYFTYDDAGRHQTVVWPQSQEGWMVALGELDPISAALDFDEAWPSVLPDWFRPRPQSEILAAFGSRFSMWGD